MVPFENARALTRSVNLSTLDRTNRWTLLASTPSPSSINDQVVAWGLDLHIGRMSTEEDSATHLYLDAIQRLILAVPYTNKCQHALNTILQTSTLEQQSKFHAAKGGPFPYCRLTMCPACLTTTKQLLLHHVLAHNISGDWFEAGTWRGGQSIMAAAVFLVHNALAHRKILVADSFCGLPPPVHLEDVLDAVNQGLHAEKEHQVAVAVVEKNFQSILGANVTQQSVVFIPGFFNDSLPVFVSKSPRTQLSFLRLDGDMYQSTMDVLENMYFLVVVGGVVLVDDYNLDACRAAVTLFREKYRITEYMVDIIGGGVYWIRSST